MTKEIKQLNFRDYDSRTSLLNAIETFVKRQDIEFINCTIDGNDAVVHYVDNEPSLGTYYSSVEPRPDSSMFRKGIFTHGNDECKPVIENLKKEFYKSRSKILTHVMESGGWVHVNSNVIDAEVPRLKLALEQLKKAGVEMTL